MNKVSKVVNQSKHIVSTENRVIARSASTAFGGTPSVSNYHDRSFTTQIDVLSSANSPAPGLTAYSTVNLSDTQFKATADGLPLGVEMAGACLSHYERFGNIISTAAFLVNKKQLECEPGAIFEQVVVLNDPAIKMKHLIFVSPFVWGDQPETLYLDSKAVAWLQAIPISDGERDFALHHGVRDLEDLFDKNHINIYDLNREPAV